MTDHPREVQWYLAKYIPDLERNEPRNVGLIMRPADAEMTWRFLDPRTVEALYKGAEDAYVAQTGKWTGILEKYGVKCLRWIGKRSKKNPRFYIEQAGGRIVAGRVVFDALYERLVL